MKQRLSRYHEGRADGFREAAATLERVVRGFTWVSCSMAEGLVREWRELAEHLEEQARRLRDLG